MYYDSDYNHMKLVTRIRPVRSLVDRHSDPHKCVMVTIDSSIYDQIRCDKQHNLKS